MARLFALALLALAPLAFGLDVRAAAGASLHLARHPLYDEPLRAAPLVFAVGGLEIAEDASALSWSLAAAPAGEGLDWETTLAFRHDLSVDWGILTPFLHVGVGATARSAGGGGDLTRATLFPEVGVGVRAAAGALGAEASLCYRPAPVPLPFVAADAYPLRRVALEARLLYLGRSGRRGLR